jgi:hypothetical protein
MRWHRAYYKSNRERIRQMQKEYRRRNLKRDNLARVIKRRTNIQFALRCRIRNHARKIVLRLPSIASRSHYLDLLGCTLSKLTSYLESKFLPGNVLGESQPLAPRPHSAFEDVRPLRPNTAYSRLPLHQSSAPLGGRQSTKRAPLARARRQEEGEGIGS